MKAKPAMFLMFFALISTVIFCFFNYAYKSKVKCQGFVQYNLMHDGTLVKYDVLESVFLFEPHNSIIFHGFMYKNGHEFTLERKISLSKPERIDADTISINLKSSDKTTNDIVSDDDFRNLLSNIGFIGDNLRLDIDEIHDGSYILGNSTSYNFICTPYYQ